MLLIGNYYLYNLDVVKGVGEEYLETKVSAIGDGGKTAVGDSHMQGPQLGIVTS